MPSHSEPYRALAFDYGTRKIGVAVGESLTQTAKPLAIVKNSNNAVNYAEIENIIKTWRPNKIIVGIPVTPEDNLINPSYELMIKAATKFSNKLKELFQRQYKFELHTVNEAFTSIEANRIFVELRKNKQIKQGTKVDDIAACLILERWFGNEDLM